MCIVSRIDSTFCVSGFVLYNGIDQNFYFVFYDMSCPLSLLSTGVGALRALGGAAHLSHLTRCSPPQYAPVTAALQQNRHSSFFNKRKEL